MTKVFVSGCYDILHAGHIEFFHQAKSLGEYLIVSLAGDAPLAAHKRRRPSLPVAHKRRILESLRVVDEVVVGEDLEAPGLDFKSHFLRIRPDILAATDDDLFADLKRALCRESGARYVMLRKRIDLAPISTSSIIRNIRLPEEVPLRVDFAGGWLDVPCLSRPGAYIVNCAVSPCVGRARWPYRKGGGLGGSRQRDPVRQ